MRGISSVADIGAIGGGFLSIWMAAEPVTGIAAFIVMIAVSRLVKRGADDREKRIATEMQETGDSRLLREIESIKNTVNFILVILIVSILAYFLRSFSLVDWIKYIFIAMVFLFLIIVFLPSAPADIEDNKNHNENCSKNKNTKKTKKWWQFRRQSPNKANSADAKK